MKKTQKSANFKGTKIDHAIRYQNRESFEPKPLSDLAARHLEYITKLESLGFTRYRISVIIDRPHTYVDDSLKKGSSPGDDTIGKYSERLFLNQKWIKTGEGKMITSIKGLRALAKQYEPKKRPKRNPE